MADTVLHIIIGLIIIMIIVIIMHCTNVGGKRQNECSYKHTLMDMYSYVYLCTLCTMCTEPTTKKDNGDMKDNGTCSTTNVMTANSAYGTTSRIMAHNTTANPWICEDDELIVMHKNPTYATSAEKTPTNYV